MLLDAIWIEAKWQKYLRWTNSGIFARVRIADSISGRNVFWVTMHQ
jgi:hypothetical protein